MKLAIMQPYFLPYIGYFQLIRSAEVLVLYDNIEYTKKGWINRNRILQHGQEAMLSLPLKSASDYLHIGQRQLADNFDRAKMLRQIEETFSPPGMNYSYQDIAGRVINEPIRPGVVQIQFLLDTEGNVRDVRRVSGMGQMAVDEACMNALRGQNFGVPPPEVFSQGPIFGINFIFPSMH